MALPEQIKSLWADNFAAYLKAHGFHMNLTGEDFFQYHKFTEEIYTILQGNIDTLGEGLRTLDEVVPANLARITSLTSIPDATVVPDECDIVKELYADIEELIAMASTAFDNCATERKYGLQNILADYLESMEKLCWMLRASMEDPKVEAAEMAAEKKLGIPEEPTPKV